MKKAFKIFWTVVVVLAIMLFAVWMLLQIPGVQTYVARKAVASIEKKIDGRIEFSKVYLKPFNAIVIKDFVLLDSSPVPASDGQVLDTIATAGSVVTTFSLKGLFKKEGIHLGRINLNDGSFTMVIEPVGLNVTRVFGGRKGKKEDKDVEKDMGHIFDAKKINVDNFRFRMKNIRREQPPKEYGMDWRDMDLTVHSLSGRDLSLAHGYMKGVVDDLSASEKSGYSITSLSGRTMVGHGKTIIQDVRLIDPWSDIRLDEYTMSYANTASFSDYVEQVTMTGSLRDSKVAFKSLSYFAPALKDRDICLLVSKGEVEGKVTDLGISRFDFREQGSRVAGSIEGRITGLPDVAGTVLDFWAENLRFTSEGLGKFIKGFAPSAKMNLSRFAPGEEVTFDGRIHGKFNDLVLSGKAGTESMGMIEADIRMKDLTAKGSASRFSGHVSTENLDLGKILGVDKLGEVTMRGILDATLGDGKTNLRIDTLTIDKLHLLDYDYSNIIAVGTYSDKAFDGRLVSHDPNLNLLFQGIFTFSDKTSNGLYKFYANVGYADLQALGLDKRGVSKVSGRVNANYMTIGSGDVIGDLDILDLNLENSQGLHDIGNIKVTSHSNNDIHRINLNSSFADGSYIGSKPVTSIIGDLKELTLQKELPVLCKEMTDRWKGDTHDLRLDFHDSRDFLSFVMPGLYIADSTRIRLSVKADGEVKASVKSSRIAMEKNYLRNLDLAFDNKDGSLNGVVTGSELKVAGVLLRNDNITLYANDDHVGIGCVYDNEADLTDKGELFLSGEFERDEDGKLLIHGKTLPSNIWFNDEEWVITPTTIEMAGKDLKLDNLTASSGEQYVKLDGGFSSSTGDTLRVELSKLNMALANRFVGQDFGISGRATGHAMVTSPWKDNAGLIMSIMCDSVMVAGKPVGQLRLGSSLDEAGKVHLIARNDLGGRNTLDLRGDYFTKDKSIDMLVGLDEMEVGYLEPLLSSVFSEMAGQVSGKVRLKGKTDALSLSGEDTRLDDVLLKVAYTGVPYFASGPVQISDNGIVFDGVAIKDRYDGTGTMTGGILFDNLKDIRMDTRIRMSRMEAIDMGENSGQAFYGNVFASGSVSIRGPFNAIRLDINARTDKNGALHIPIDNASRDGSSNLLTFKEPYRKVYVDPYEEMMNSLATGRRKSQDFGLHLRVNANQGTEAFVEIDRAAGNILSGKGQGNIDIQVRPSRDLFTINGDYTLASGNFHFNAMDIAKRDFTLSDGSSIRFNGDVMDSDLDINGLYTTKASVATLIADTTSISTRRTVNCGVMISGKLREPQLTFSIDVPDLDPTTKSKVESALNTEDKVQRQFISLLISGGFMPEEQSGVVNNTSMIYSNLADIMAGQLNNILQKLDIPLDFGLNYQSTESGNNIFDVAVSTQLFNNRVIVNGNVGNREYRNSAGGDVVGDLDIEIKLDKPGQVRLSLFSHSADDYTSYLDNTQRNGVGIAYQREFNTFKEFFREIFRPRPQQGQMRRPGQGPGRRGRDVNRLTIGLDE